MRVAHALLGRRPRPRVLGGKHGGKIFLTKWKIFDFNTNSVLKSNRKFLRLIPSEYDNENGNNRNFLSF